MFWRRSEIEEQNDKRNDQNDTDTRLDSNLIIGRMVKTGDKNNNKNFETEALSLSCAYSRSHD